MASPPPYVFLFTDQNTNREFVVQPYTMNGPSSPDGGVDPSAATANTSLFLYGKGSPNYGERVQDNMLFLMEHFFSPIEPSFPIPGQVWCRSSANELTTPFQLFMYNPRTFKVTASSTNQIYVVSDDGSLTQAQVLQRFLNLGLSKQFTVYDSSYNETNFFQSALPVTSGPSNVLLTVTPAVASSLVGQFTGGWEEIYQGNATVVLRRPLNAGGYNLINLANPINPQDAATKAYVDSAVHGGTLTVGGEPSAPGTGLSDVIFQTPNHPQTGAFLYYNGTNWTDLTLGSFGFLPLAGGTMTGGINMNGNPLTNLVNPVNPFDAVRKEYVDNQPLSAVNVLITSPANGNILVYNSITSQWNNSTPLAAGIVPISGGVTMTGPISMGGQVLTGLTTPVNPSDAVTLAYAQSLFTSGSGVVTSGTFNDVTGVLTLNISGGFPSVNVSGFLPTPNNMVPAPSVNFIPQNPSSLPLNPPNQFFPTVIGDGTIIGPNDIQDPINVQLNALLNQLDVALGNFVPSRQRLALPMPGGLGLIDINHGAGLSLAGSPNATYVKGSENLAVYLNGIKQVSSTGAIAKITSFTVGGTYTGSFTAPNMIIAGNVTRIFHPGVQFNVSGTLTTNDGNFIVTSSSYNGTVTTIAAINNGYSANNTQVSPFITSGTGTVTYTVTYLRDDMETGYTASSPLTIQVTVNSLAPVTVSINPSTINISNLGLLRDAINTIAVNHYINSITSVSGLQFQVPGNVAYAFPAATQFIVRYSNGNNGSYTVSGTGSAYSAGFTTINVTTSIPNTSATGVIFQDNWGFTMSSKSGIIAFHSNIPGSNSGVIASMYPGYTGSASSISVTDPGAGTGLFSGIAGITWPMSFTTPLTLVGNAIVPADYAYSEVGMYGTSSSLFVFGTAPVVSDTMEIVIDRELIYNANNPLAAAIIYP